MPECYNFWDNWWLWNHCYKAFEIGWSSRPEGYLASTLWGEKGKKRKFSFLWRLQVFHNIASKCSKNLKKLELGQSEPKRRITRKQVAIRNVLTTKNKTSSWYIPESTWTSSLSRLHFRRRSIYIRQKHLFLFIQPTALGLQNLRWKRWWSKASPHPRRRFTPVQDQRPLGIGALLKPGAVHNTMHMSSPSVLTKSHGRGLPLSHFTDKDTKS